MSLLRGTHSALVTLPDILHISVRRKEKLAFPV
jgi:hypothetical protein